MPDVSQNIPQTLRDLAWDVRRIGNGVFGPCQMVGNHDDPETILNLKEEVAENLYRIARQLEAN